MKSFNKLGQGMPRSINIIVALLVLVGGVAPLLAKFGVIGELPTVPAIVFSGLLAVSGILLLLDALIGVDTM